VNKANFIEHRFHGVLTLREEEYSRDNFHHYLQQQKPDNQIKYNRHGPERQRPSFIIKSPTPRAHFNGERISHLTRELEHLR